MNKNKFIKIETSYNFLTDTIEAMDKEGYEIVSFAPSLRNPENYVVVGKSALDKTQQLDNTNNLTTFVN